MYMNQAPDPAALVKSLERINSRRDCADFDMAGYIRLLYQFGDSHLLGKKAKATIQNSLLGFKYWPDEPGRDSMCTWSENHHILFSSAGYLAGQLFPDKIFRNSGRSGSEQMSRFRPRVIRWLDLRYKTGFSEWLSNVYYTEDIAALLNLIDFAQDDEIVIKATMVLDLMLLDLALNHYRGTFGSTHGRSYFHSKINGARESTASIYKLLFDLNTQNSGNMASIALALSPRYHMPKVLFEIANDTSRTLENQQRMGIRIKEAQQWGLDFDRLEDGMTFLSFEAYSHPKTINLTMRLFDDYGWWQNSFFAPFAKHKKLINIARTFHLLPTVAHLFEKDLTRNMRPEVNIYTYRTADYMLSTAQDWRKGYGGDQQAIWSATLGSTAICFTTHPVVADIVSPSYWTGSGNLPRAAQVKNVAIILYKISTAPGLYVRHKQKFTHAWFPQDAFDEVRQQNGWLFARKGDGYLALWSRQKMHMQTTGEWANKEIIAEGKKNIWICELGRQKDDISFDLFIQKIANASIQSSGLNLHYASPSQGELLFGWNGSLLQNKKPVRLSNYARYKNPYVEAKFPGDKISIQHNGKCLKLDYENLQRKSSEIFPPQQSSP